MNSYLRNKYKEIHKTYLMLELESGCQREADSYSRTSVGKGSIRSRFMNGKTIPVALRVFINKEFNHSFMSDYDDVLDIIKQTRRRIEEKKEVIIRIARQRVAEYESAIALEKKLVKDIEIYNAHLILIRKYLLEFK